LFGVDFCLSPVIGDRSFLILQNGHSKRVIYLSFINMTILDDVINLCTKLTGQPLFDQEQKLKECLRNCDPFNQGDLGYSQFNELLLTLGYDRVTEDFFKWVFGDEAVDEVVIESFENMEQGVDKFRQTAMLLYGHIKFAFKRLSQMDQTAIEKELKPIVFLKESYYANRHEPLHRLHNIPSDKAYYLGYIVEKNLKEKRESNPDDEEIKKQQEEMERYRQLGQKNHDAYLVSDHMDVYVATSMRERFEFLTVNSFVEKLFQHGSLKDLKLRYFDPTQAYCEDRIDKGLVEGLMIKRARCTIYHVQESDTFGKDSELAATLAQGKPVIAYIPEIPEFETFKQDTLEQIKQSCPYQPVHQGLLKRLQRYYPEGAWEVQDIRDWVEKKSEPDVDKIVKLLHEKVTALYNKRADTLKKTHPLGLQVNLSTGVANGVLVVRSTQDCAWLLKSILLNQMKFEIEEENKFIILRERISKCIYRVASGDASLINAFWNFYLKK
jgi:hypothetical protein